MLVQGNVAKKYTTTFPNLPLLLSFQNPFNTDLHSYHKQCGAAMLGGVAPEFAGVTS